VRLICAIFAWAAASCDQPPGSALLCWCACPEPRRISHALQAVHKSYVQPGAGLHTLLARGSRQPACEGCHTDACKYQKKSRTAASWRANPAIKTIFPTPRIQLPAVEPGHARKSSPARQYRHHPLSRITALVLQQSPPGPAVPGPGKSARAAGPARGKYIVRDQPLEVAKNPRASPKNARQRLLPAHGDRGCRAARAMIYADALINQCYLRW